VEPGHHRDRIVPGSQDQKRNGRICARNLPQRGCIFTVDLPRLPIAAAATV